MKRSEIKILQKQFLRYLSGYYENQGFEFDAKETMFYKDHIKLYMNVDSESGPYYTVRPYITVEYPEIVATINNIISKYSNSMFLTMHWNSLFYLDSRTANFFNCKEFDKCEENNFTRHSVLFLHKISEPVHVLKSFSRHKKYMELVGFKLIETCNDLNNYYQLLKSIYVEYFKDLEEYPVKKLQDRPHILKPNDIYSLVYLGREADREFVENIIDKYDKFLGDNHYQQIDIAKLILNHVE